MIKHLFFIFRTAITLVAVLHVIFTLAATITDDTPSSSATGASAWLWFPILQWEAFTRWLFGLLLGVSLADPLRATLSFMYLMSGLHFVELWANAEKYRFGTSSVPWGDIDGFVMDRSAGYRAVSVCAALPTFILSLFYLGLAGYAADNVYVYWILLAACGVLMTVYSSDLDLLWLLLGTALFLGLNYALGMMA